MSFFACCEPKDLVSVLQLFPVRTKLLTVQIMATLYVQSCPTITGWRWTAGDIVLAALDMVICDKKYTFGECTIVVVFAIKVYRACHFCLTYKTIWNYLCCLRSYIKILKVFIYFYITQVAMFSTFCCVISNASLLSGRRGGLVAGASASWVCIHQPFYSWEHS